jgi:hypothetical protein
VTTYLSFGLVFPFIFALFTSAKSGSALQIWIRIQTPIECGSNADPDPDTKHCLFQMPSDLKPFLHEAFQIRSKVSIFFQITFPRILFYTELIAKVQFEYTVLASFLNPRGPLIHGYEHRKRAPPLYIVSDFGRGHCILSHLLSRVG